MKVEQFRSEVRELHRCIVSLRCCKEREKEVEYAYLLRQLQLVTFAVDKCKRKTQQDVERAHDVMTSAQNIINEHIDKLVAASQ